MLKVLLVEDSPEIQRRLVALFADTPDVEVVGCAATAEMALWMVERRCPDVVLLDLVLRDGERGHDVLHRLARLCPHCRVVVLTNFGGGAMREAFLQSGASAYFDKSLEFGKARDWILAEAARRRARSASQ